MLYNCIKMNEALISIQETLNILKLNIKEQKEEIQKVMLEQQKKEEKKQSMNYWIERYKELTLLKMENKIKLMKMNNNKKNISNQLSYITGIMEEIHEKENNELNVDMLEDFLSI